MLRDRAKGGADRGLARDVGRHDERLAAAARDLLRHLLEHGAPPRHEGDARAEGAERDRCRASDPARRAGDDDGPAAECPRPEHAAP